MKKEKAPPRAMTNGAEEEPAKLDTARLIIDPDKLNWECVHQPGAFAYEATRSAQKRSRMERLKNALVQLEASLGMSYRTTLPEQGIKVTEASVDAAVKTDESYVALRHEYDDACEAFYKQDALVEAYRQRKDMIVQLSVLRRAEMENMELNVKEKKR